MTDSTNKNKTPESILVTGATGLVGSHLLKVLVSKGYSVKALYRTFVPEYDGAEKIDWVQCDILDIVSLEEAMADVQKVYHCAAIVSFNPSQKKLLNTTNIEGTANVVNACINTGVKKLLFVSSVSALGRIRENEPITEKMSWTKETSNSEYGKTKFYAEMEVWRGAGEGLNAVIVNPVTILGASDWKKGSAAIFKNVYKEFPWYSDGVTGWIDVEDVVNAMILLMESNISNERFILSAENIGYRELFNRIADEFGKKRPSKKVTPVLAALVWRVEALKAFFTGSDPLVTKETAATALVKVHFDNSKLLQHLPHFKYTPVRKSIARICAEFKEMYNL
ncbi:MAG TPA: NAD-dependent epimerase/dehydratase family protein [Panacibacter sp.]|nr:NAD-dependent epimerase/dehydratase family protein [Panacibacter sp.]